MGLGIASVIALIFGILGGVLSYFHWDDASILNNKGDFKWYLVFFISEMILAVIGAIFLLLMGKSSWVSIWVSFIVAIHFVGLKFVFNDKSLFLLTSLMILVTIS